MLSQFESTGTAQGVPRSRGTLSAYSFKLDKLPSAIFWPIEIRKRVFSKPTERPINSNFWSLRVRYALVHLRLFARWVSTVRSLITRSYHHWVIFEFSSRTKIQSLSKRWKKRIASKGVDQIASLTRSFRVVPVSDRKRNPSRRRRRNDFFLGRVPAREQSTGMANERIQ